MRVLVVEDDRPLADAIARGLRKDAFAVDLAHDGEIALQKASVVDYDVIVLDRDLPVVHGDDVCRALGTGDDRETRRGIGLTIVESVVAAHGGELRWDGGDPGVLRVEVRLPRPVDADRALPAA